MSSDDDYEVGYGKPPKNTQFKKGMSGNGKGRPKGTRNFETDLEDVLSMKVTVNKDGRSVTVSSQHAALMRMMEKALNGDQRLLMHAMSLAMRHSAEKEARSAERQLSASDQDILKRFEESILSTASPGTKARNGKDDNNG